MKTFVCTFILFLFTGLASGSDVDIFPKTHFDQVYQLDIDTSYKAASKNAYVILADNYHDFLYLVLNGTQNDYQKFKKRHSSRLKSIDNSSSSVEIIEFCKAETDLQWALINWRFGEYIKSGLLIRRAYKNLIQLQIDYPEFKEINKSLGLLHILLSAIPEEYDWLVSLFGFENNFDRGYRELSKSAKSENHFQLEAKLFFSYVNIFILNQKDKGFEIIENLDLEEYKITSLSYIIFCHKAGENEKGLNEIYLDQWIFSPKYLNPIISLLRGELHLKKLEYQDAILNYKAFLFNYSGIGFRSNARLKLYYAFYLLGDDKKAIEELNRKANTDSELIVSDKYAQKFFENGKAPDKILLKSRLLYDGGYYSKAKMQIDLYSLKSFYDKKFQIEYYYRKARIEQSLKNLDLSISSFKNCIQLQGKENYYFAPNSCLQLGYLYQNENNMERAKHYFTKAMEYKRYPYKQSISHQAKSALNALD